MRTIIEVKHISKSYRITTATEYYSTLRDALMNIVRAPLRFLSHKARAVIGRSGQELFWALKNVNVEIKKGEIFGVIGPNGAGKSTFLKVLNRITEPSSGEIIIQGKISSLLEVGTGFHPELTGRENIFFSGAILGMKRREIARKFNDIVKFAEMEQFIDTPVKRYSSGMHVRLAFSVAAHMEPDILLIDEVLAVGDARFQKKCLEKIHEVAKKDQRTIVFVSHNLDAVQNLCDRAMYLERGEVKMVGATAEVIKTYLDRQTVSAGRASYEFASQADKPYQIRSVVVKNPDGLPETNLEAGQPFSIEVHYDVSVGKTSFWIYLQCINEYGSTVFLSRDFDKNPSLLANRQKGRHVSTFVFPATLSTSLNVGRYAMLVRIYQDPTSEVSIPIQINDTLKKFAHHPGVILIGEPWQVE